MVVSSFDVIVLFEMAKILLELLQLLIGIYLRGVASLYFNLLIKQFLTPYLTLLSFTSKNRHPLSPIPYPLNNL